jgi:polysaccharide biosynthesis protein PslH
MRILQLCHKPPFPPIDGGCKAMDNLSQGFIKDGVELKILSIETHKHPFQANKINQEYIDNTAIEAVFVDTSLNVVDAVSNLITQDSYNITRFFSPDFDRKLVDILKHAKFDIIHLESLFMTPYMGTIRRLSKAPVVLRSHNLEYMIWERMAETSTNVIKKNYLKILASQLKKYEKQVLKDIDAIVSITKEDTERFKTLECCKPIITIPFGIDINNYIPNDLAVEPNSVFHLGAMDWLPNIEGVEWFKDKVWDKVLLKNPELNLYLAGKNMPEDFAVQPKANTHVIGEVESAREFMNSKSIMIVPLLSAGGMRVKIIEGMALKKAVVSTSIGAEGIDCKHGENIFIADTPEEFVSVLTELNHHPELIKKVGENARKLVESNYNNGLLTARLIKFYDKFLENKQSQMHDVNLTNEH